MMQLAFGVIGRLGQLVGIFYTCLKVVCLKLSLEHYMRLEFTESKTI